VERICVCVGEAVEKEWSIGKRDCQAQDIGELLSSKHYGLCENKVCT